MNATAAPALPSADLTRWLAVACVLGMLVIELASGLWLAAIRPSGVWVAITVIPLILPLPGLLRRRMYTYRWVSLLVWLYFIGAVVGATTGRGLHAQLALLEGVLCLGLFTACVLHIRGRLRSARPHETQAHADMAPTKDLQ